MEGTAAHEHRTVRVRDLDVTVTEAGDGPDGVVLVHGIGVSARYFGALGTALAATHHVVAPDLPGFGTSPTPDRALSVEDHAAVVAELIVQAGLQRPLVVGHSMGCQVAVELAAAHPDAVGGLVLIGPVVDPSARSLVRQAWRLLRDTRHETFEGNVVVFWDYLRAGVRWYTRHLPTMLTYPTEERIADVGVPVVVVRGEHDPIAPPRYVRELAARARDGRVAEVPDKGHVAMFPDAGPVAALCRAVRC